MELQNNSNDMKTNVQTYLIEETVELIYDNEKLDKWNDLVRELGLEGQSKVCKTDKSPIPFMHMKKGLYNVFNTLCPRTVKINEYSITPIPVEILDLIALSKRENYFSRIEIMYDDKDPDPVCVGVVEAWVLHEKGTYNEVEGHKYAHKEEAETAASELGKAAYHCSWRDERYLIGRWADVKASLSELKERAMERFMHSKKVEIQQKIRDCQRELEDLETTAINNFN